MGDLCAQGLDQAVETRRADRGKHRPVVRDRCVSFGSVANFAPRRGAPRAPHATTSSGCTGIVLPQLACPPNPAPTVKNGVGIPRVDLIE